VQNSGNNIKFNGDDFDKIYSKYFAREQNILLNFPDWPLELHWHFSFHLFLFDNDLEPITYIASHDAELDELISNLQSESADKDVFVEYSSTIEELYTLMVFNRNREYIEIGYIDLTLPWLKNKQYFYSESPDHIEALDKFILCLEQNIERADSVEASLKVGKKKLPVVPITMLSKKVMDTANEELRKRLAFLHDHGMREAYIKKSNIKDALFHADLSCKYNPNPNPEDSNNLGYLYMVADDKDKARDFFEKSIAGFTDNLIFLALANYNLGILEVKENKFSNALDQ